MRGQKRIIHITNLKIAASTKPHFLTCFDARKVNLKRGIAMLGSGLDIYLILKSVKSSLFHEAYTRLPRPDKSKN